MEFKNRQGEQFFLILFKPLTVFIVGSIVMHLLVMFLDYFLMTGPIYLNLRGNFLDSIFSIGMLPMLGAYGLFSVLTYFLWVRMKKALLRAQAEEIKNEKVEAVLGSMQRITGMLAEHIATHNAEIMHWVEFRKINGRPVSAKIERPCNKIANALHSLSEISFIFPYTKDRPDNVAEIEKILQDKLSPRASGKAVP